ncbi:hypothetical protein [Vannielia litorea]|uniref:hypothetical protein n=1 Tax=Vannielia litorea TaxID=1217970 RepID=UPI001BCDFB7D|nr:hypothetical protein [Vannielia litorea]MBS8228175.1 hypothetical protein [Vannielia litorea]
MSGGQAVGSVIVVDGVSYVQLAPEGRSRATGQESALSSETGNESGPKFAAFPQAAHAEILRRGESPAPYDAQAVARDFPLRWQRYIRANFRDPGHVQRVFSISERAARKWWNGEGGANGASVAIAMHEHPVAATRMLFAAE